MRLHFEYSVCCCCLVVLSARFFLVSSVRRRLNAHALHVRVSLSSLLYEYRRRRRERESVVPANLCIVVGCATKRARGYRDLRGKGGQLDVVCGTWLYIVWRSHTPSPRLPRGCGYARLCYIELGARSWD